MQQSMQEELIQRYMNISDHPTFRQISEETGIQITRVFRLFNGSKMKLHEFESFGRVISKKSGLEMDMGDLGRQCQMTLPLKKLKELEQYLRRELMKAHLANGLKLKGA